MKFCKNCNNMYYHSIDETDNNKLIYYCRYCGDKDYDVDINGSCVLNTKLKKEEQQYYIINEYTKFDPTLPRIYNIKCPNDLCITNNEENKNEPTEVIYMRYDDVNMKYLYICVVCDTKWKTNDNHI